MTSNLYSFTPVRRRKAEFDDDTLYADPKHWTAARCNRLLRSLKSRIELLKKDATQFTSASLPAEVLNNSTLIGNAGKKSSTTLCSDNRDKDDLKPRKRVRVTYAGRSRPKAEAGQSVSYHGTKSTSLKNGIPAISRPPGEVSVETPILIRNRPQESMSRASAVKVRGLGGQKEKEELKVRHSRCATVAGITVLRSDTSLKLLQPATNPKRYTLYVGIYNALEALLKSTEQAFIQAPERSNSLFSLCLRNIHQRIQLEEDWEAIDTGTASLKPTLEKRDISGEIYNDLEDFGTSEFGWRHLRTVVRAHGVQIVADAILSGLISQIFGEALVMLCSYMDSYREAETLMDALLLTLPKVGPATPYSRVANIHKFAPLSVLEKYVTYTGRISEYFRIMTGLFRNRILAVQWLATKELSGLWARVFHAISNDPPCPNATEFLQEALPLMLNASAGQSKTDDVPHNARISEAIGTTFSSVLATLSAVVILDEITVSKTPGADTTDRGRNVITILRHLQIEYSIPSTELKAQDSLVFLANLLAMPLRDARASRCEKLIKLLQKMCQHCHSAIDAEIAEFMCSVARCCGRGLSDSGLEHFKRFSLFVDACSSSSNGQKPHLLQNIIVSSAYVFSQQVPIAAHLDYADDIRAKFQTHPPLAQGKSPNIKPTVAFRWEEGISEWVAPTPAIPIKRTKNALDPFQWHDSEIDSPVPLYRRSHPHQIPSFPVKRGHVLGQRVAGRVSDLIPSSPSNYGSDGMEYDEGDTIVSNTSPPPRLASVFARKRTVLHNQTKNRQQGNVERGSFQHSRDWDIYIEDANVKDDEDTDEEDELSAAYNLPAQKLSMMAEVESNSQSHATGHNRADIMRNMKSAPQGTQDDIDYSGDELSF